MGSSTSKPREGHEHPGHMVKVGSLENRRWEHRMHMRESFGGHWARLFLLALAVVAVAGFIVVSL
ncbi:MAG: hypothetical protein ABIR32_05350 [Ilumatobacteraceae bacterium]